MGLLSSLLSIGGGIIGSAVPGVGTALGASIGGAIGGAIDSSGAANGATGATIAGITAAQAANDRAYQQIQGYQAPYLNEGGPALNALNSRLGLNVPPPSSPPTAANAPTQPSPTAANALSYSAAAPAVATGMQTFTSGANDPGVNALTGQPITSQAYPTTTALADPTLAPASGNVAPAATPTTVQPSSTYTPAAGSTGAGDGTVQPGTYGSTANPTEQAPYATPTPFTYGLSDYTASPGYQYQVDQATKATLAGASATGALQSGAAMKALQDRAQNIAYQDYTGERSFAANQNQTNVNNALNAYNTNQNVYDNNRDYLTTRYDTETNDLFKTAQVGQTAAGVVSTAAGANGTADGNAALGIGTANANNALAQGQIGNGLAGGLVTAAGQIAGNALNPVNYTRAPVQTNVPDLTPTTSYNNPFKY